MAGPTAEQKQQYDEQGYVLLQGLFEPGELDPVIREIEAAVDQRVREHQERGCVTTRHEDLGFKTRLMAIHRQCEDIYKELTLGSPLLGPAMFDLMRHPRILDVVESIVGSEVHCEGRHNLRPKVPNYDLGDFRWHEDTVFEARRITYVEQQFGLGPNDPHRSGRVISRVVAAPAPPEPGLWIPLVDVDERNGCLSVLPGGHRHVPPYAFDWDPSQTVPQLEGLAPLSVPMRVGDALLLHQHMPHLSPPNQSDHIRWSLDLRYQDGRRPAKMAHKPGFLARSRQRPRDVITTAEDYQRILDAAKAYANTPGIQIGNYLSILR